MVLLCTAEQGENDTAGENETRALEHLQACTDLMCATERQAPGNTAAAFVWFHVDAGIVNKSLFLLLSIHPISLTPI